MTETIDTTQEHHIPYDTKFYCLIGKKNGLMNGHTFFHMGFVNSDGHAIPLLEIGKISDLGARQNESIPNILCNALFSHTGAIIHNEYHLLRRDCWINMTFDINYVAFEVTLNQYLYFLGILKEIDQQQVQLCDELANQLMQQNLSEQKLAEEKQKIYQTVFPHGRLRAYQPYFDTNIFHYEVIEAWENQNNLFYNPALIVQALSLSCANTCRHTGIDFLTEVLGHNIQSNSQLLPSQYFMPFHCQTTIQSARYHDKLYLLPLPPNGFDLSGGDQQIMQTLHQRMESLLQQHFFHPNTHEKFELMKNIYTELATDKSANVNFLEVIVAHAKLQKNVEVIQQHRSWHWPFFHQTKTQDMFERFETQLSNSKTDINHITNVMA